MAINPNNALPLRHISYCGASGSGKAVAVKLLGKVGKRAVIFDPMGDYLPSRTRKLSGLGHGRKVHHYYSRKGFANAFLEAWKSGREFAIAYTSPHSDIELLRADALWFGQLVHAASDGKRELHAVFEELGRYSTNATADRSILGWIANVGRKFGIIAHWVYQRPMQIPKTFIDDCDVLVVGAQNTVKDAKRWVEELDCSLEEIIQLGVKNEKRKKHYLLKEGGIGNYKQVSLSF